MVAGPFLGPAPRGHQRALPESLDHANRPGGLDQQVGSLAGMRPMVDVLAPVHGVDHRLPAARVAEGEEPLAQLRHDPLVLRARRDDALGLAAAQVDPEAAARSRRAVGPRPAPVDPAGDLAE